MSYQKIVPGMQSSFGPSHHRQVCNAKSHAIAPVEVLTWSRLKVCSNKMMACVQTSTNLLHDVYVWVWVCLSIYLSLYLSISLSACLSINETKGNYLCLCLCVLYIFVLYAWVLHLSIYYIHIIRSCVYVCAPCYVTKRLPSPPPTSSTITANQKDRNRTRKPPSIQQQKQQLRDPNSALNRLHSSMFGGLPTSIHSGQGILRQQNHGAVLSQVRPPGGFGSQNPPLDGDIVYGAWECQMIKYVPKFNQPQECNALHHSTPRCFVGTFSI